MENQKSVIDTVKELQAGKPDGWPHALRSKNANEVEICIHFPAIAEALVRADKALRTLRSMVNASSLTPEEKVKWIGEIDGAMPS